MPELRRRARGQARDARSRSSATSARRWSTSRKASAATSRTTRRTTRRASRRSRSARTGTLALGTADGAALAGGRLRRALRRARATTTTSRRFWREYLLYHRTEGFAFLVDADDGWSWARRSPACRRLRGDSVALRGRALPQALRLHRRRSPTCSASSTGAAARRAHAQHRLRGHRQRSEQAAEPRAHRTTATTQEIVWSAGETLDAPTWSLKAFRLAPRQERRAAARRRADRGGSGSLLGRSSSGPSSSSCC